MRQDVGRNVPGIVDADLHIEVVDAMRHVEMNEIGKRNDPRHPSAVIERARPPQWRKDVAEISTRYTLPLARPLAVVAGRAVALVERLAAGGFGGERGPSDGWRRPDRPPDHRVVQPTRPEQALLYRLCGDRNPLHSDPEFAAAAGFPRPILHGLCTYGMTCKALVDALLDADVAAVASYGARFTGVAYPGETLKAGVWKEDGRLLATVSAPARDNAAVLTGVELIPV